MDFYNSEKQRMKHGNIWCGVVGSGVVSWVGAGSAIAQVSPSIPGCRVTLDYQVATLASVPTLSGAGFVALGAALAGIAWHKRHSWGSWRSLPLVACAAVLAMAGHLEATQRLWAQATSAFTNPNGGSVTVDPGWYLIGGQETNVLAGQTDVTVTNNTGKVIGITGISFPSGSNAASVGSGSTCNVGRTLNLGESCVVKSACYLRQ